MKRFWREKGGFIEQREGAGERESSRVTKNKGKSEWVE